VTKRIMVIGAGPAGMECAIAARQRGHEVTVFDKSAGFGGQLRGYGNNDLAHREDLLDIIRYYEVMADKLGIEMRFGTLVEPKLMRSMLHHYDVAVVATGARIAAEMLPPCTQEGLLLDAIDVADGSAVPGQRIVVLGAGKIGLTLAESLASQGREVSIVESSQRIAGDVMPSFKWRHSQWVQELKIPTYTSTRVVAIGDRSVRVVDAEGQERELPADSVIAAVERRPNQQLFHDLEWMIDEVHGCGDALVPQGLTRAIHSGYWLGVRL
jgi:2,4-dienoyl-CoA reductase (NADPH2)